MFVRTSVVPLTLHRGGFALRRTNAGFVTGLAPVSDEYLTPGMIAAYTVATIVQTAELFLARLG